MTQATLGVLGLCQSVFVAHWQDLVGEILERSGGYPADDINTVRYYTNGSIFADWIHVSAVLSDDLGDKLVTVQVPSSDPGIVISDDWDGFRQRLTGSGTTNLH